MHGRPQEGQGGGALATPLEFEKMTSYAAVLQNTLKYGCSNVQCKRASGPSYAEIQCLFSSAIKWGKGLKE